MFEQKHMFLLPLITISLSWLLLFSYTLFLFFSAFKIEKRLHLSLCLSTGFLEAHTAEIIQ